MTQLRLSTFAVVVEVFSPIIPIVDSLHGVVGQGLGWVIVEDGRVREI